MSETATVIDDGGQLASWLGDPSNEGKVVQTHLKASERVIARVTDGIYRRPASALRELISNAWDADAQSVTILTDAPRFSRIYVRDDGRGMTDETLARLLHNIGGSAKRREDGQRLGVASETDPDRTPGGRLLIGKIGIGLFSISQLARRFQIITKAEGANYRLLAEVRLRTYSDDDDEDASREGDDDFISGEVFIRREHSDDLAAHGTDIILDDVKPPVRDILRSAERWRALEDRQVALDAGDVETWASMRVTEPTFHSGYISDLRPGDTGPAVLTRAAELPWSPADPPEVRMSKLMDAVESEFSRLERPDLATTLDAYLEMLWALGLSAPVSYVDRHPFDLTQNGELQVFWVTKERGRGQEINLSGQQTVREAVQAQAPGHPILTDGDDPLGGFRVVIAGVELRRPIRFKFNKTEKRGLDKAVLFVGTFSPDLRGVPSSQRGGDLALEGYLFWSGRIVPKENNGVLVRIRGASGALFDNTFFGYQVSEQTRLRQITSELFVQRGMDPALNIDRESFNFSHPHVQLVTRWLHSSIRQLTNRLKDEAARAREGRKEEDASAQRERVVARADEIWRERRGEAVSPDILIADSAAQAAQARAEGSLAIVRSDMPALRSATGDRAAREAHAVAVATVLSAFNVLEDRTYDEQQALIEALLQVFYGAGA